MKENLVRSQDRQTLGWRAPMAALEVMKPTPHCTAKETISETMGNVPEATRQVCDSIWTRGHIFQCLLGVARLFSQILTCV